MTESPEQNPQNDAVPPARRRYNPRLAMLLFLGTFIIVVAFAVVMSIVAANRDDDKASGDSTDVAALQLGADDSTFTATTLPPTGVKTMDGDVTDLGQIVDGKPTMINMFSASCTACLTEMPALENLHQTSGDELQLVGVNLGDSEQVTRDFVSKTGVTYEIIRDPSHLLVAPLNITAQPMTLWVDAEGNIAGHRYGELSESEMRFAVKDYLGIELPIP